MSPFYWDLVNAPAPRPTSLCVLKYDVALILFPSCQLDLSPLLFYDEDLKEAQNGPEAGRNLVSAEGPRLCVLDRETGGFGFHLRASQDKPGTFIGQVLNVCV